MVEGPVTVRDGKSPRAQKPSGTEGRGTDEQGFAGTPQADVLFPVLEYL